MQLLQLQYREIRLVHNFYPMNLWEVIFIAMSKYLGNSFEGKH
jgi:hypothetical protein